MSASTSTVHDLECFGLFPPKAVSWRTGNLNIEGGFHLVTFPESLAADLSTENLLPGLLRGMPDAVPLYISRDGSLPAEGYVLEVAPENVRVSAADANGLRYALQVINSLARSRPEGFPCFRIRDWPLLPVRGLMLDISRCKVPQLKTLRERIGILGALRFNQLQLYTEHTFAFPGHRAVWQGTSPLTARDYQTLDRECRHHGIELVPNLNSFGHMERWLRHPAYQHLAEHPQPFTNQWGTYYPNGTTLKPNKASADFMDGLFAGFLSCFSSDQFHIGCDETWELGKGWSAPEAAKKGLGTVYLNHIQRLYERVRKHGKTPQFWADIILEYPEVIPDLPRPGLPVIWGYERHHPFAGQCARLAAADLPFLVAPGTSSWLSLSSRWTNARENIRSALEAAMANGGQGMLLTDWGDRGHHQFWLFSWPACFFAAAMAWTGQAGDELQLRQQMVETLGWSKQKELPQLILKLAQLDQCFTRARHNWSPFYELLIADQPALQSLKQEIPEKELEVAREALVEILRECEVLLTGNSLEKREFLLTAKLMECALLRGLNREREIVADPLLREFNDLWLKRNRPGGLQESIRHLKTTLPSSGE